MTESDILFNLALQHIPKIGAITAKKLINHCGSAEAVFKEKRSNLLKIDGIGVNIVNLINSGCDLKNAESELRFIKSNNIKLLYYKADNYPDKLKHCIDAPIILFQSGNIAINKQPIISIVGTRKITTNGIYFCEKLVEELAVYNPIIVSGFAYGTDITAHKSALKHNLQTIGCLAHGLNQIYPKVHDKYRAEVEQNGGFFTDFWSTDNFDRNNFLKRNRIIAGLSEATIVIESAEKGGSLVTADIASSYDREVFAVPGRISDAQSIGCNNLIKYQKAHLLSNPMDVPYILNWKLKSEQNKLQPKLFPDLTSEEQLVVDCLNVQGKSSLDEMSKTNNIPTYKLAGILLNLELKGVVRPLPGKQFQLV